MGSEGAGGAVQETVAALKTVFRNDDLRRLNLAYPVSAVGDWAYATAITVWIFGVAGASGVAVFGAARLGLMAVLAPFASTLADRFNRKHVMVLSDLIRAVLIGVVAAGIFLEVAPAPIFVLLALASMAGLPFRPAQAALVPSLVNEPIELTAANGTTNTLESVSFFVGPAVAGVLLTFASVPAVLVVNVLTFLWSMALVMRIESPARAEAPATEMASVAAVGGGDLTGPESVGAANEQVADPDKSSFLADSAAGFRFIWAHSDLRMVTAMYGAQTLVAGASLVFGILLAVQFGLGPEGVGYLDSALGVGAVLGGLLAISRGSKNRLGWDFGWGVIFWAVPLVIMALAPQVAVGFLAMAIIGGANPVADINASTILQRLTPDEVMGRVFGALESFLIASMAVGALIMPVLVDAFGLRWALGLVGAAVVLVILSG
ncbi:MAG: MFS transporter, partial [Acidimicrobiia bacterium]